MFMNVSEILYYIYLQAQKTIEAHDADWKLVCDHIPSITWCPTSRAGAIKYRPSAYL